MGFRVVKDLDGVWLWAHGHSFPAALEVGGSIPLNSRFWRDDLGTLYTWNGTAWATAAAPGALTVEEADGVPSVASVTTIRFDSADGLIVTDLGGGVARIDLSGIPASALAGVPAHATSHQDAGSDEISVTGLSGLLADAQKVTVRKNSGADVGTRKRLNFIETASITWVIADDAGGDEIDITGTAVAAAAPDQDARIYGLLAAMGGL